MILGQRMVDESDARTRHGETIGPLQACHSDRIREGFDALLFLRSGFDCAAHPVGTMVQVVYTERGGRKEVDSIVSVTPW